MTAAAPGGFHGRRAAASTARPPPWRALLVVHARQAPHTPADELDRTALDAAVTRARDGGDGAALAVAVERLGLHDLAVGDLDLAGSALAEAGGLGAAGGLDPVAHAEGRLLHAMLLIALGEGAAARAALTAAAGGALPVDLRARLLEAGGLALLTEGAVPQALPQLRRAVTTAERDGDLAVQAAARASLAVGLAAVAGRAEEATATATRAVELALRATDPWVLAAARLAEGRARAIGPTPAEALGALRRARQVGEALECAVVQGAASLELADLVAGRDRPRAAALADEAVELFTAAGADLGRHAALRLAAELFEQLGDYGAAVQRFREYLDTDVMLRGVRTRQVRDVRAAKAAAARTAAAAAQQRRRADQLALETTELARRTADLERLSRVDALTGLANRRAFDAAIADLARRRDGMIAVLVMDLDHFKQVNDRHSHQTGDAVLRRVGRLLSERSRAGEVAYRHGGEEFALLAPHVPEEDAAAIGERLRQAVEAGPWDDLAPGLAVTVSVGVACAAAAEAPTALLRADQAMYAAKAAGRNRVVVHPGETVP